MLKIEKLTHVANLQEGDVITHGKAELKLNSESCKGVFNVSHAGTGEMAEISVAKTLSNAVSCTASQVTVKLTGCIKRTLEKGSNQIDISNVFATATINGSTGNIRVLNPDTLAPIGYNASTGPITGATAGVISFKDNATADTDYLIEVPFAEGTAADPDVASGQNVTFAAGNLHIHVLSRLKDDVANSHMHNVTSFTVTKQNKAAVDL